MSQKWSLSLRTLALALPLVFAAAFVGAPDALGHEAHKKQKKTAPAESKALTADAPHTAHSPETSPSPDLPHDDGAAALEPTHSHDDAEHHTGARGLPKALKWLGNFHPAAVNFPVALLTAAALAELLWLRTRRELFFHATRFCVWIGATGAVAAALLGWFFAGFQLVDDEWNMTLHRWLGTSTALWSVVVLLLCERAYRGGNRLSFRLALGMGALLVATTGFFGGALLYGLDHYAW